MGGSLRGVRIGALLGVPLEINPSWLITLAFFVFILGGNVYPSVLEGQPQWFYWTLAAISGLFFFSSIVIHEMAHSLVARRYGLPVRAITLFMLGGVSQITREARRPLVEFLMAIAGPLTSVALAGVFLGLVFVPGIRGHRASIMWEWLFVMNLSLAVVNLAPGFPLDGGRVLRAAIWGVTGNFRKATRWASIVGRALGMALIGAGALTLVNLVPWLDPISGLWFVLVGWFLENAARQSWTNLRLLDALRARTAGSVMQTVLPRVDGATNLLEAVSRYYVPQSGFCAFVVDPAETVIGMLTEVDAGRVPRDRWPLTNAASAMTPVDRLTAVAPQTDLASTLEQIDAAQQAHAPVVEDGRLVGFVTRGRIMGMLLDEARDLR
jgi:Zn-dependent protease/CBS domain-containing protein